MKREDDGNMFEVKPEFIFFTSQTEVVHVLCSRHHLVRTEVSDRESEKQEREKERGPERKRASEREGKSEREHEMEREREGSREREQERESAKQQGKEIERE